MSARFVRVAADTASAAFVAQGIAFEYFTPDPATEEALLAEAQGWRIKYVTEEKIDHDEYGDHSAGLKVDYRSLTEVASLSDQISYYFPAADMIVDDGHLVGVAVYVGKNTDRYGYYATIPIAADPYYGLAPNLIRPSNGEVVHSFCLLYTDGRIVGDNHAYYTSWEDREVHYYTHTYSIIKADKA